MFLDADDLLAPGAARQSGRRSTIRQSRSSTGRCREIDRDGNARRGAPARGADAGRRSSPARGRARPARPFEPADLRQRLCAPGARADDADAGGGVPHLRRCVPRDARVDLRRGAAQPRRPLVLATARREPLQRHARDDRRAGRSPTSIATTCSPRRSPSTSRAQGTRVDPTLWQKRNIGYRRLDRIRTTLAEIERVVPAGGTVRARRRRRLEAGAPRGPRSDAGPDSRQAVRRRRPRRAAGGGSAARRDQAPRASRRHARRLRLAGQLVAPALPALRGVSEVARALRSAEPCSAMPSAAAQSSPRQPTRLLSRDADLPARRATARRDRSADRRSAWFDRPASGH